MFERRLKILLSLLCFVVAGLVLRAADVQLFNREYWKLEAVDAMKRTHLIETSRGRILDVNGHVLAEDQPCINACVDYRAIPTEPDDAWVKEQAIERLKAQLGDPYDARSTTRVQREEMRQAEMLKVRSDIEKMWVKLAEISGKSLDDIDDVRAQITHKVEWRQRYTQVRNFYKAQSKQNLSHEEKSYWKQWLIDGDSHDGETDMDKFAVKVAEQFEPHVILPAVDNETQNELGKNIEYLPGLVLRPGTHRYYPYREVAAHLLGQLGRVDRHDLEDDEKSDKDELRQILPNDLIGKGGIEALCEPALRGTRGQIEKVVGDERILSTLPPVPGQDVRLSIDIELQKRIQNHFAHAVIRDEDGKVTEPDAMLHGAAIVMDVPTGQLRAMVSYPTYDENHLDDDYAGLALDGLNRPLMNRATMEQVEPGSTVKPMVGLAAITSGVQSVNDTIECTGYLVLDGKRQGTGRCWVATMFSKQLDGHVAHHPVPFDDPHPTGFLTFSDGLQRSCNVYFETTADRLGIYRLSDWFGRFGLGNISGLGIAEAKGRLPTSFPLPAATRRSIGWAAGIGEESVLATPIQMADVAATIARGGIWIRPTLLAGTADGRPTATRAGAIPDGADRVNLNLSPEGVKAAQEGMWRVVNTKAGTGKKLITGDDVLSAAMICGKTGTAQTSPLEVPMLDSLGKPVLDQGGKPRMQLLAPSTAENPNPSIPWYRGTQGAHMCHAWYIGFAPRDHPQIAFAVLVDYGQSGGIEPASVARALLHDCIDLGYLRLPGRQLAPATSQVTASAAGTQ
jgi:penicillin-binding protein 2